jgi:hypothetical protein
VLRAKRAGEKVGAVFVLPGCCKNAILCLLRNRVGDRRAIDDERDGGGRELEMLRQLLQAHRFGTQAYGSLGALSRFSYRHCAKSRTNRIGGASMGLAFETHVGHAAY